MVVPKEESNVLLSQGWPQSFYFKYNLQQLLISKLCVLVHCPIQGSCLANTLIVVSHMDSMSKSRQ